AGAVLSPRSLARPARLCCVTPARAGSVLVPYTPLFRSTGGSNFPSGTANVAALAGTATFPGLVLNNAANGYTLTASAPGVLTGAWPGYTAQRPPRSRHVGRIVRGGTGLNGILQRTDVNS